MTIVNTGFVTQVGTQGSPGTLSVTYAAGETAILAVYGGLSTSDVGVDVLPSDGVNTYTLIASMSRNGGAPCVTIYKADNVAAGTVTVSCGATGQANGFPYGLAIGRYTGVKAGIPASVKGDGTNASGSSPDNAVYPSLTPNGSAGLYIGIAATQNNGADTDVGAGTGFTSRLLSGFAASNVPSGWEEMAYSVGTPITPTFTVVGHAYDFEPGVFIALENAGAAILPYRRFANTGNPNHLSGVTVPRHFMDA